MISTILTLLVLPGLYVLLYHDKLPHHPRIFML